jgi:hypothetical protein
MLPAPLIEAFSLLDELSYDQSSGKPLFLLEIIFECSNSYEGSFHAFIQKLVQSRFWSSQNFPNNPFPGLCCDLSHEIDCVNDAMGLKEPPYHRRGHFQDVCMAITLLLQQPIDHFGDQVDANLWSITASDAWLLLFSAIGHDFGHDGSTNQAPYELEKASVYKIRSFLHRSSASPEFVLQIMPKVEKIILATDPSVFGDLVNRFSGQMPVFTKEDCMAMLLVEADLMGSTLPKHGVRMGQQLSNEWKEKNPDLACKVISPEGRLGFLNHIQFISPQSKMLGVDRIQQESIKEIRS